MKIAIWGYGWYGRRMFESLTRFCSEEYEVVRVYDKAYQKMKKTEGKISLPISNPDELPEDYSKGLFEKVLFCIFFASNRLKQVLRNNSIPELHLGSPEDLYPISSFEQGKKPFEINREGYDLYVIKNLCGATANYESYENMFLFNGEGKVVKEHRDRFNLNLENYHFYDYPFVFRHSKAEKIFLAGQYCILTRIHSGNYWHFTNNNLDVIWLLEKEGFKGRYVVPEQEFCKELLYMLNIPPERIIPLHNFEHNKIYIFEEVFTIAFNGAYEMYSAPVLLEAADYIKKKLPTDPSLPKKIYVKRIGRRKLLGADEILAAYGFTTVIPENYSVREQMTLFYNADIVFCVHGANSTNCLYMRKGTVFVEAFSSYWINPCNLCTVSATGVHYLPVSPLQTVFKNEDVNKDFELPEALLCTTIQNAFLIRRGAVNEQG